MSLLAYLRKRVPTRVFYKDGISYGALQKNIDTTCETYLDVTDNTNGGINLGQFFNGDNSRGEGAIGTVVLSFSFHAHKLRIKNTGENWINKLKCVDGTATV
jgi:hypothetical protein